MADKLGVANLYGVATLSAAGTIHVYGTASLQAEALVSASQGSAYSIAFITANATVAANMAGIRYASVHPLSGKSDLTVASSILNSNAPSVANLTCQSSVVIIANTASVIKNGKANLISTATLDIDYDVVIQNSAHLYAGNCYSPGYYEQGYIECTNVRATAYIAVYASCNINTAIATMLADMSMDWTRNNTWRIGELCRIQQQLLTAVLEVTKRGQDHLVADDIQPLFEEYDKIAFEVQNV